TSPPSRFLSGCPRIYHPLSPICGSDGVTYPNKCAFCIAKSGNHITIIHQGQCEQQVRPLLRKILRPRGELCWN
uniref:Kazal-like domain-containing protein n=1 Tax=Naja naja TaxID=35670 RepID=A0A8C6VGP3_NAJNA